MPDLDLAGLLSALLLPPAPATAPIPLRLPQPTATASAPIKSPAASYTPADLSYLARTAHGEAEGEGTEGLAAVMNVIRNRVGKRKKWGSIRDVVQAPYQFESWEQDNPRRKVMEGLNLDDPSNSGLVAMARAVLEGNAADPTKGANLFYAPKKVQPGWADRAKETAVIGNHRFMRE